MFALIAAVAATLHAAPHSKRFADVQVGTVSLRIPFPRGYCAPTGKGAATAQLLAATDDRNVTLLTLVRCQSKDPLSDYLIVKVPILALNADVDRPTVIEMMAKEVESPEFKAKMGEMAGQVSDRFSDLSGTTVKIDTTVGPRGHDDVCVYMGGGGSETFGGKSIQKVMGMCTTAAGSRIVNLHAYKRTDDATAFEPLLPFLRKWAVTIRLTPK